MCFNFPIYFSEYQIYAFSIPAIPLAVTYNP